MNINEKMNVSEAKSILKENKNILVNEDLNSFVELIGVEKIYPNGVKAVHDFNLSIKKKEFVALVGPSGCGKSTTLRMIAGLEEISSGELYIDKIYSNYLPSKDRDIAMVFQSYALYPNKNVYDNIAFGLKIRHIDKKEIEKRVFEAADILDLGPYLDRLPKELSGGQMQRVALGRAIVRQANIFLMDEPLSNLDAKLRVQMRSELVRIHNQVEATTIYVTHDQTEAMTMANKIVVMNKGFVKQIGKPIDVYNHPDNLFVATFIGSPAMNILKATYDNGKIILDEKVNFEASKEMKKAHFDFYNKQILDYQKVLENIENNGEIELLKLKSNQTYIKGESVVKKEKVSKIAKFIAKFNKLFNKKNEEEVKLNHLNELKETFEKLIENAKKALNEPHEIFIGIRPEKVKLGENKEALNFESNIDLVELLGSEYILHTKKFDKDFVIKVNDDMVNEETKKVSCSVDLKNIHIFDLDSGLSIK